MKKSVWITALLAALVAAGAAVFWLTADQDDAGPSNALTPEEVADGWTMLFDGETTKGWHIDGEATIEDGLLVLGGDRATTATSAGLLEDFELRCDYRFVAGQEGLLEMKRDGSGSSYGLGYLTPKPGAWNRAVYTRKGGQSSLVCQPLRKPLLQWVNMGPAQGTEGGGPVHISFNVGFAGSKLALRNIKLKPLGTPGPPPGAGPDR
jgi:hypothetical protein